MWTLNFKVFAILFFTEKVADYKNLRYLYWQRRNWMMFKVILEIWAIKRDLKRWKEVRGTSLIEIHQEISIFFEEAILKSDLFSIIQCVRIKVMRTTWLSDQMSLAASTKTEFFPMGLFLGNSYLFFIEEVRKKFTKISRRDRMKRLPTWIKQCKDILKY